MMAHVQIYCRLPEQPKDGINPRLPDASDCRVLVNGVPIAASYVRFEVGLDGPARAMIQVEGVEIFAETFAAPKAPRASGMTRADIDAMPREDLLAKILPLLAEMDRAPTSGMSDRDLRNFGEQLLVGEKDR